ncbi:aspartic peptidase domain-containing protein [Aspergillus falconensis]
MRHFIASSLLASAAALNLPRHLLQIRQATNTNKTSHTISLTATLYGSRYNAPVTIGNTEFSLLVDTGSSDTFVIEDDFECVGQSAYTGDVVSVEQSQCAYASAAYNPSESDTFEPIANETFLAAYGAGVATGSMAFEDITLGGVTVTDQRFGLVNMSSPMGLGASGILGLAYPVITSAYEVNGTLEDIAEDLAEDLDDEGLTSSVEQEPYSPLFVSMARRGLVEPYFSLALKRLDGDKETGDGGVLVLGGLPDVELANNFTTVAAEYYKAAEFRSDNGTRLRSYWATTVQKVTYGDNGEHTASYQTIVDSGAPMNYVPTEVADGFNRGFSSSAQWDDTQGAYLVDCDADAPDFAVQLGGTTFKLNPADLILRSGVEFGGEEICVSAVTRGLEQQVNATDTTELYILGAGFLKSVVAVFDFGNSQMRFAERGTSAASALQGLGAGKFVVVLGVMLALLI